MPDYPQISRAGKWNFTIQQGSTFSHNIVFTNFDISEYEFRGMIRRLHTDRVALATLNIEIIANNEIECNLTHIQTAAMPAEQLVYDIEMFYSSANTVLWVSRILEGKVRVTAEVTK